MFRYIVVLALVLATSPASAQPAAALGKPLASSDLPAGTIVVRVVAGSPSATVAGMAVALDVAGTPRAEPTDVNGRARFDGIAIGAAVQVSVAGVLSERFVVPSSGGTRIMLSIRPWVQPAAPLPTPRTMSGSVRPDEALPPGTLDVRLTYNDLADRKPPAKVAVTLVGYAADDTVTVMTQATDAEGVARFTKLDHTGAIAYYAFTLLPRNGSFDRLVAEPAILDATGARVLLSGDARTAKTAAIDELQSRNQQPAAPKGKVHIQLGGAAEPNTPVSIVDAATGKVVASGTAANSALDLAVPRGGQALYAVATSRSVHYRSQPFEVAPDRGSAITVLIYPRTLLRFSIDAEATDRAIVAHGIFTISNNSWIPFTDSGAARIALPLPTGFTHPILADDDREVAMLTPTGIELARPLAPGELRIRAGFELAATKGKVQWTLPLPYGTLQSQFRIVKERGMTLEPPTGVPVETRTEPTDTYLALPQITILPHRSMVMTIGMPKLAPAELALARACRGLEPDRATVLRDKPMIDFTATQLDGTKLRLGSLRGKVILVNFMASWDTLSTTEIPTFTPLAKAVGELAIVLVASDTDAKVVAAKIGPKSPVRVVLDLPPTPDVNIGTITTAWGVKLLPESFLIDRHGIVRFYLSNSRDWSMPAALACVKALARE